MAQLDLFYHVDLHTSLHIGTGVGFSKMVDDTVCRAGPAKGNGARLPYIPGSSIKGKVKSRCEALADAMGMRVCGEQSRERKCKRDLCLLCRLFGSTYTPGGLYFSDAILMPDWQRITQSYVDQTSRNLFELSFVRTGNKLERATRTVEPDFLFSLEQTADGLRLKGSIVGEVNVRSPRGAATVLPLEVWMLVAGLHSVDKIGGLRSRGLGRCRISISHLKIDSDLDLTYKQLTALLGQDDYLLGLSEYDQRTKSNT